MPGEFYFMALGGLGVSLAGFAGLIAALDRRPATDSPVAAWRIRNIVLGGFILTFAGFGTVATYPVTGGDAVLTARIVSGFLALVDAVLLWSATRPGPEWPSRAGRRFAIAMGVIRTLGMLANVGFGSLGFLQVLFLVQLLNPVSIFINTVRQVARGDSSARAADSRNEGVTGSR
jgi:hypothetical protein